MRRITSLLACAAVALLPQAGVASDRGPALERMAAAESPVFAAGGTPASNGIFFPGTQMCLDATCYGEPLQIARGTDLRLYNLDLAVVANSHGIVSDAQKRSGAPLFWSPTIGGPGSTLVKTSHLKPGTYAYSCKVHGPMRGVIEVTP